MVAADRGRFTSDSCRFEVAFDNSVESPRFEVAFGNRAESPRFEVSFGKRAESHISQRSLPAAFSKVQAEMQNFKFKFAIEISHALIYVTRPLCLVESHIR